MNNGAHPFAIFLASLSFWAVGIGALGVVFSSHLIGRYSRFWSEHLLTGLLPRGSAGGEAVPCLSFFLGRIQSVSTLDTG